MTAGPVQVYIAGPQPLPLLFVPYVLPGYVGAQVMLNMPPAGLRPPLQQPAAPQPVAPQPVRGTSARGPSACGTVRWHCTSRRPQEMMANGRSEPETDTHNV